MVIEDGRPAVELAKFEQDKENLRPKASGRSAAVLAEVYSSPSSAPHSSSRERRLQAAKAKFEAKISELVQEQDDSVVTLWERYANWAAEWYPTSVHEERGVLERATRYLAARPAFKEDLVHLKLWIRLAHLSKDPQEIYNYLFTNEIGSTHVDFYENWAYFFVLQKHWDEAAEAVRIGMARDAQPKSRMTRCREKVQKAIGSHVSRADPGSPSDPLRPTFNAITVEEAKQLHRPAQMRPNQQRAPGAQPARRGPSNASKEPEVLPDASYASSQPMDPAFPLQSCLGLGDSLPRLKFFGSSSERDEAWRKTREEHMQRLRDTPKPRRALMRVVGPAGFGRLAEVPDDDYDYDDHSQYPQPRPKPSKAAEKKTTTEEAVAEIPATDGGLQTEKKLLRSILSSSWKAPPKPEAVAKKENNQAVHAEIPFMLEEPGMSPQRRGRGRGKGAGKNRQRAPQEIQIYVDEDLQKTPQASKSMEVTPAKNSKRSPKGQNRSPVQTPKSAKNSRASKAKSPLSTPKSSEPARTTPRAPVKESRKRRATAHGEEQDSNSAQLAASLSQLQLEEPPTKRAKAVVEEPVPQTPPCKPRSAKKGNQSIQRSPADEPCWSPPRTSPRRGPTKTRSSMSRSGGSMKSEIDPEGLAALRAVQDAFPTQRGSARSCSRLLVFED